METLITESNFCSVGEGTKFLKPLRVIGRVVHTPAFGDSLLAVARKAVEKGRKGQQGLQGQRKPCVFCP